MELRIAQLRKRADITQSELAELTDTTQQQIAKIEIGNVDPRVSTLAKIARALKCTTKDLFYSKKEFLTDIERVIRDGSVSLRKTSLMELNSICWNKAHIPVLHPFWELIEIKNNQIHIKEAV